ncbi:MAG: argininosuccinate synthase [Actinomycetota bacterium]
MMKEKVVLAYSGGLDTSVAIRWLQEKYNMDVIALTVDLGQARNMEEIRGKALKIGASEAHVVDAREEFANNFIVLALQANALYEGKYPVATALGRPLIAKHLVEQAVKSEAKAVAHGCTGKGNDQVRFDVSVAALNSDLKVIAPLREWKMTRQDEIEYAAKHDIPISVGKSGLYSIDENIWGRSVEGGVLENPWVKPPPEVYIVTADPGEAPDKPENVEVTFEEGIPRALNGESMSLIDLISKMDDIGGRHGFGRIDMIENRLVGIKSREIYEAPGALALIAAHRALEDLNLERDLIHYKTQIEQKYAELIYNGLWYSPLREALDAFISETQKTVSGVVKIEFYKGSMTVVGRKSEDSLYDYSLATYDKEDIFPHEASKGFIQIWGMPLKIWSRKRKKPKGENQ